MNRRHFLKGAGTALLGVATLGLVVKEASAKSSLPNNQWEPRKGWWVSEGFGPDAPFYWAEDDTLWDTALRDTMRQASKTRNELLYNAFKTS